MYLNYKSDNIDDKNAIVVKLEQGEEISFFSVAGSPECKWMNEDVVVVSTPDMPTRERLAVLRKAFKGVTMGEEDEGYIISLAKNQGQFWVSENMDRMYKGFKLKMF